MKAILSVEQMRAFEAHATSEGHVPSLLLMENAGRGATDELVRLRRALPAAHRDARVVVVAGCGNNGGDGFVVARRLHAMDVPVTVFVVGAKERIKGDARSMLAPLEAMGVPLEIVDGALALRRAKDDFEGASVIVDALFGTGLDRPITGLPADVIAALNCARRPILSLDLPSGIHADTGATLGVAVHAARTVTFAHAKPGLLTPNGALAAGALTIVDIGVPPVPVPASAVDGAAPRGDATASTFGEDPKRKAAEVPSTWLPSTLVPRAFLLEAEDFRSALAPRSLVAHKGTEGHVLLLGGSPGKLGAIRMAARGAHRAGAGLVTVATREEAAAQFDVLAMETMSHPLAEGDDDALALLLKGKRALVVGPGLGLDEEAHRIVATVLRLFRGPVVFDADALTLLATQMGSLPASGVLPVLTPHPGEAARILGTTVAAVEADRFTAARHLAAAAGGVVVLKGARTLIAAPDGTIYANPTGSPALAAGGSGDVLAGIVGALVCRLSPRLGACTGVFVHGLAAERWAERHGSRGLLASEVADLLPETMVEVIEGRREPRSAPPR